MSGDEIRHFQYLLRQLGEGSQEAAQELAETYGTHVRRCVRQRLPRKLRSKFDSIDFVQLVWKSVFAETDKLVKLQDPEEFVRLLAGMARNKVAGIGRQLQTQKKDVHREVRLEECCSKVDLHPPSRDPTPSAMAIFREEFQHIVQEEPRRDKKVVELRYEGNTFHEIAKRLQIDESTARKVIRRLKRKRQEEEEAGAADE
jgi:RNA polymerase sigma factor (sigma-70 family)